MESRCCNVMLLEGRGMGTSNREEGCLVEKTTADHYAILPSRWYMCANRTLALDKDV